MARAATIVQVLGGARVVGARVRTLPDLAERLRAGLPFASVDAVADALGVSREAVTTALALPARTLARRRLEGALHADEADRVCRLARLVARAIDVLDDRTKAAAWMTRPNRALGGATPLSLAASDLGAKQVDDALGRIEHGIAG